jgi:hypothetical protein
LLALVRVLLRNCRLAKKSVAEAGIIIEFLQGPGLLLWLWKTQCCGAKEEEEGNEKKKN